MASRALVVWFVLLVVASANGVLREALLIPSLGDVAGRAVSTLLLSAAILALTFLTIRWMAPSTAADAWTIGAVWVALTLGFEFLAGHYVFGHSWSWLLRDYDVLRGRIWVLVLIATAAAPRLAWRGRTSVGDRRCSLPERQ